MLNLFALSHSTTGIFRKITEKHWIRVQVFVWTFELYTMVLNTKFKAMLLAHCNTLKYEFY